MEGAFEEMQAHPSSGQDRPHFRRAASFQGLARPSDFPRQLMHNRLFCYATGSA
jgi:hypothetical protein